MSFLLLCMTRLMGLIHGHVIIISFSISLISLCSRRVWVFPTMQRTHVMFGQKTDMLFLIQTPHHGRQQQRHTDVLSTGTPPFNPSPHRLHNFCPWSVQMLVSGGSAEAGPSSTATTSQIQPQPDEGSGSQLPQSKRLRNAPATPPPRTKAAMEKKKKERRPVIRVSWVDASAITLTIKRSQVGMTVRKRVVQARTVERRWAERSGERRVAGARVPGRTVQLDVYNAGKCAMR